MKLQILLLLVFREQLIKLCAMKNPTKVGPCSQQQLILVSILLDPRTQFINYFSPSCMSFYVSSQNMYNTYSHNTTHSPTIKNQPLLFSIHYRLILCIFIFIVKNLSPSLFKITISSLDYGLDFRLDSQLNLRVSICFECLEKIVPHNFLCSFWNKIPYNVI